MFYISIIVCYSWFFLNINKSRFKIYNVLKNWTFIINYKYYQFFCMVKIANRFNKFKYKKIK